MSDGLSSGVKANILATLTSTIALTMIKNGLTIEETVETIIQTLPVDAQKNIAYSTFTIVKITDHNKAYIAEFDGPETFFLRRGQIERIHYTETNICGKLVREASIDLKENDVMVFVSDGALYASAGQSLNLNWKWEDIAKHLKINVRDSMSALDIKNNLLGVCDQMYLFEPGDDTTVCVLKAVKPKKVKLFTGPPSHKEDDAKVVHELMNNADIRIVSGGTTSQIVARELGVEVKSSTEIYDKEVPPIAYIQGVDLVTEGVLTLSKTIDRLKSLSKSLDSDIFKAKDGASQMAKLLYSASHIKLLVGRSLNIANAESSFQRDLELRLHVVGELEKILVKLGKIVTVEYY
ncbi:SpoIIE family protein phosphatase [Intestinibacter bartlettii]|uniref:SpoIIE family protein phosphatase n=1 Tax=Intestinibacter bartlettii TaxID=261299 RepID=UPI00321A3FC7